MTKRKKLPLVQVEWIDAFDGPVGWIYAKSYNPDPVRIISTGFFLKGHLLDHFSFCSSYFYDAYNKLVISNPVHIPMGMVLEVKYVDHKVVK